MLFGNKCQLHYFPNVIFEMDMTHLIGSLSVLCVTGLVCNRYVAALKSQTHWIALQQNSILWLGYFLILLGGSLNLCTLCSLGIRGAYLGKYWL